MQDNKNITQRHRSRYSQRLHQQHLDTIRKTYDNSSLTKYLLKMKKQNQKTTTHIPMPLPNITRYLPRQQLTSRTHILKQNPYEPELNFNASTTRVTSFLPRTHQQSLRCFIFESKGDNTIKKMLLENQWIQCRSKNSTTFSLKWLDHDDQNYFYLRKNQHYNHIKDLNIFTTSEKILKNLRNLDLCAKTFDLARQQKQFCHAFDRYAIFILLKKHIEYFTQKVPQLVNNPSCDITLIDLLRTSNFTAPRDNKFLINIPLMIQACLYCEQCLLEVGLGKFQQLQIRLQPRNIQALVNYSKLDPPYQYYESFKHSSDQEHVAKHPKEKLSFSKDFLRFSGSTTLDTPSQALISILVNYHNNFASKLPDYACSGLHNKWQLIDKNSWQRHKQINTKSISNSQHLLIQKVIENQIRANHKTFSIQSYILITIKGNKPIIYYLNSHQAVINQHQSMDLEQLCYELHLDSIYHEYHAKMKQFICAFKLQEMPFTKNNCFQTLKLITLVDQLQNLWFHQLQSGQVPFSKIPFCQGIAEQFLTITLNLNFSKANQYQHWIQLHSVDQSTKQQSTIKSLTENYLVKIKQKLQAGKRLRNIVFTFYHCKIRELKHAMKECSLMKIQHKKQKDLNIILGHSILHRIFKKRFRNAFFNIYS